MQRARRAKVSRPAFRSSETGPRRRGECGSEDDMSSTLTVYGLAALDVLATSLPLRWLWPRADLSSSPPPEVCLQAPRRLHSSPEHDFE